MQCPTDGSTLTMSERSGIEIDYCPQCRGIWLDRGELDKLIERSFVEPGPGAPGQTQHDQGGQSGLGGQPGGSGGGAVGKIADQVIKQVQQRAGGQGQDPRARGAQGGRRSWLGDILR